MRLSGRILAFIASTLFAHAVQAAEPIAYRLADELSFWNEHQHLCKNFDISASGLPPICQRKWNGYRQTWSPLESRIGRASSWILLEEIGSDYSGPFVRHRLLFFDIHVNSWTVFDATDGPQLRQRELTVNEDKANSVVAAFSAQDMAAIGSHGAHFIYSYVTAYLDGKVFHQAILGHAFPDQAWASPEAVQLSNFLLHDLPALAPPLK